MVDSAESIGNEKHEQEDSERNVENNIKEYVINTVH
jgi:hypothetical protein